MNGESIQTIFGLLTSSTARRKRLKIPTKYITTFFNIGHPFLFKELHKAFLYALKMKEGDVFPPIRAYTAGPFYYTLVDGCHRWLAHLMLGREEIEVEVLDS